MPVKLWLLLRTVRGNNFTKEHKQVNLVLFDFWLSATFNNFSVMSGKESYLFGINKYLDELMCFAQEHYLAPMGVRDVNPASHNLKSVA